MSEIYPCTPDGPTPCKAIYSLPELEMHFIWGGGGGAVCILEELWGYREATAAHLSSRCDKKRGRLQQQKDRQLDTEGTGGRSPGRQSSGSSPALGKCATKCLRDKQMPHGWWGLLTTLSEPGPPCVHFALEEPSSGGSHHSLVTSLEECCRFARAHLHWECPRTGPALLHRDRPLSAPRNT